MTTKNKIDQVIGYFSKNEQEFGRYDRIDKSVNWSKTFEACLFSWLRYWFPNKDHLIRGLYVDSSEDISNIIFDLTEEEISSLSEHDVILLLRCWVFYSKKLKCLVMPITDVTSELS